MSVMCGRMAARGDCHLHYVLVCGGCGLACFYADILFCKAKCVYVMVGFRLCMVNGRTCIRV